MQRALSVLVMSLVLSVNVQAQTTPLPEKAAPAKRPAKRELRVPPAEDKSADKSAPSALSTEEIFKSLDYPELQVVPRASDRLQMEAQYESEKKYWVHWPIVLPSVANIFLGMSAKGDYDVGATQSEKDEADLYATSALAIGSFWVGTTAFISWSRPYRTGLNAVRKNRDSDKRGDLYRERLAEESLEKNAKTMQTLVRLSIVSNFLATAAVASSLDVSEAQLAITALLAFTPWIFEHRYIGTWDKHQEYKRKIYTPISSVNLKHDYLSKNYYPQVSLRWDF